MRSEFMEICVFNFEPIDETARIMQVTGATTPELLVEDGSPDFLPRRIGGRTRRWGKKATLVRLPIPCAANPMTVADSCH